MPANRAKAVFEPIPPDIDVAALVEANPNFEFVVRISWAAIEEQGLDNFEKLVRLHVVIGGKPLVVEGYDEVLEKWIFAERWLRDNHGTKTEIARNLSAMSDLPLTISHYLNNMHMLTEQVNRSTFTDPDLQRIYLKDIDCPEVWFDRLKAIIPPFLTYLNESTSDPNGVADSNPNGYGFNACPGIARAGDLMSCLPPEMRAENLMCYIGHEGTYTPCHQEMCGSLGHNIMVDASTGGFEYGRRTTPGSSIWFMTETEDRHLVSEYWCSLLGHDIDLEDHFAQIRAWEAAPFKTYVVEQKVGDFILIPPLAPHQVWNRGTRTMKIAWNRTTVDTLELALNEALPRAKAVCRDEQYKNKAIIYFALQRYSKLLAAADEQHPENVKVRQLQKDFRKLFNLFTQVLLSEVFDDKLPPKKGVEYLPFDSNVTCSYCRCNIFNRFLTCPHCVGKLPDGEDDCYDICMECYARGRSCACFSDLRWVEQFRWSELTQNHEQWWKQILSFSNQETVRNEKGPRTALELELQNLGHKTLAAVCQSELRRRPWVDITKPQPQPQPEEDGLENDDDDDDDRTAKRNRMRRPEKLSRNHERCHICKGLEPKWKLASCAHCGSNYCYGSLFRAFDIMPQTAMEAFCWKCPKCNKNCSCSVCRRKTTTKPYEPKGLTLGHDTRKVADIRSVETLVNFGHSNIAWLKKAGDGESGPARRLQRHQEEAERAKIRGAMVGEDDEAADNQTHHHQLDPQPHVYDEIPIDPALDPMAGQSTDVSLALTQLTGVAGLVQSFHAKEVIPRFFKDAAGISFEISPEDTDTLDPLPRDNSDGATTAPGSQPADLLNGITSRSGSIPVNEGSQPAAGLVHYGQNRLLVRLRVGHNQLRTLLNRTKGNAGPHPPLPSSSRPVIVEPDVTFRDNQLVPSEKSQQRKPKRRRGEKARDIQTWKSPQTRLSNSTGKPKRTRRVHSHMDISSLSDEDM